MADAFKISGLEGVLETLKSLPAEVVSKRGGPVRRALFKGAQVIQKQAKANFRQAVAESGKSGITDTTGFTEKQIIVRRRNPPESLKGEYFVITVKPVRHPNGKNYRKGTIKANDIAFIMEMGSQFQPATPWLRPAFASRKEQAVNTATRELLLVIDKITKKLAAANKGK